MNHSPRTRLQRLQKDDMTWVLSRHAVEDAFAQCEKRHGSWKDRILLMIADVHAKQNHEHAEDMR